MLQRISMLALLLLLVSAPALSESTKNSSKPFDNISLLSENSEIRRRCEACKGSRGFAFVWQWLNGIPTACEQLNDQDIPALEIAERGDRETQRRFGKVAMIKWDRTPGFHVVADRMEETIKRIVPKESIRDEYLQVLEMVRKREASLSGK